MSSPHSPSEPPEDQLGELASVSGYLAHFDVDDLLLELLDRVRTLLRVDAAAVLLLDPTAQQLVIRAARGLEEAVRQGLQVPVGQGFAGKVAATRRPVAIERVDATTVISPILRQKGVQSLLGIPLLAGDRLLGVLHVGSLTPRSFGADETSLLELVGERVAAAIQVRQLEVEQAAARVLQRSLLPSALPECPGMEFATRYVPAEEGGVGGDWYDAFRLPSGDLWVMAGDVAGHGLVPAVVMGRLRSALRCYALEGHPPEEVLVLADRKLQFFEPNYMATVLCALFRPPYLEMTLASAGHVPPVLVAPGEGASLLRIPVTVPLGVADDLCPQPSTVALPVGAVFVAYTDGLVERRDASLDERFERLLGAVRPAHPEIVCREIMEVMVGREIPRDDIAVIAVRRQGT